MKTQMKYVVTWFWFLLVFKGGDQSLENSKSQNQQLTKNMADSTAAGTIRNDGKIWCKCSAHDEEGRWVSRSTYFRHIQADRALQTLSKRESREFLQLQGQHPDLSSQSTRYQLQRTVYAFYIFTYFYFKIEPPRSIPGTQINVSQAQDFGYSISLVMKRD